MSRTRWKVPLRCRRCFETGEAILSRELDGPADVRAEYLAPGFRLTRNERTPDRVDLICERCNVSARQDFRVRRRLKEMVLQELNRLLPKRGRRRPRSQRRNATASHR